MEFHGPPWKASSMENTPWNSMEIHVLILHGIPWKIFHRIPWNSMEFHGGILHGNLWSHLGCSGQKANIFTHTGIA